MKELMTFLAGVLVAIATLMWKRREPEVEEYPPSVLESNVEKEVEAQEVINSEMVAKIEEISEGNKNETVAKWRSKFGDDDDDDDGRVPKLS